jgi:hypothetical protein
MVARSALGAEWLVLLYGTVGAAKVERNVVIGCCVSQLIGGWDVTPSLISKLGVGWSSTCLEVGRDRCCVVLERLRMNLLLRCLTGWKSKCNAFPDQ